MMEPITTGAVIGLLLAKYLDRATDAVVDASTTLATRALGVLSRYLVEPPAQAALTRAGESRTVSAELIAIVDAELARNAAFAAELVPIAADARATLNDASLNVVGNGNIAIQGNLGSVNITR